MALRYRFKILFFEIRITLPGWAALKEPAVFLFAVAVCNYCCTSGKNNQCKIFVLFY
jgi:hypothetical protein